MADGQGMVARPESLHRLGLEICPDGALIFGDLIGLREIR